MELRNKKWIMVGALAMSAFAMGCYKDNAESMYPNSGSGTGGNCDVTNVTYSVTVNAIMADRCATSGCHASSSPTGINLSNYAGVASIANNGKLMASINHTGSASSMPKGSSKLDACTIKKIQTWVDAGAPNN